METGVRKPIEQIQVGEMVLARNEFEPHGPLELKRVEELFTRTSSIIELEIGGQKIGTTEEHPFYVPAREALSLLVNYKWAINLSRTMDNCSESTRSTTRCKSQRLQP